MVSMKDIAQACGVSVATVSKALNGQQDIGRETREKIRQVADEMGYMTNASARALKTSRSFNIGVLFVDPRQGGLAHEYFSSVLDSIRVEGERCGYDITFINRNVARKQTTYLQHCLYRGVDGVVIASVDFADPMPHVQRPHGDHERQRFRHGNTCPLRCGKGTPAAGFYPWRADHGYRRTADRLLPCL